MADLNPKLVGGHFLTEGWCECPCAGCGEALLIHEGDEVSTVFSDDGRVAFLLCAACARRNNEEFRRRRAGREMTAWWLAGCAVLACTLALAAAHAAFDLPGVAAAYAALSFPFGVVLWLTRPRGREGK